MKKLLLLASVLILTACATVDYQPYEGRNNSYIGTGGTKVVSDGIDFWANGTPPRKYTVIGIAVSEIGGGFGDEAMIRSAVASEVRKQGGNAAIQMSNNKEFSGVFQVSPTIFASASVKRMQFAVVKYID